MKPRVLFVTAEAVPLAKTGGLGDAVSGLAKTLQRQGIDVTILMPAYPQALLASGGMRPLCDLPDVGSAAWHKRLLLGCLPGTEIKLVLLECDALFNRAGGLYADATGQDFADNGHRFAALSEAAAQIAAGHTPLALPHIVHAHDWHAGLTPLFMRELGLLTPTVQTIHNLAFQGVFPMEQAELCGIPASALNDEGLEFWGNMNFLKAGINLAHHVTTVSRTYAREILTPRFGHGLDGLLRRHRDKLRAIPNGIDVQAWNPLTDPQLPATFGPSDRSGKAACKRALQTCFGLTLDPRAPLIAHGSRLTSQKMGDVAIAALTVLLAEQTQLQVVVLGCGESVIEQGFLALARQYPQRVGVHLGYDEIIAHQLHGGADLLLHGSRFEPFGLTPVYAMRYGTVPVVSRVGGMMDTVRDLGTPGATGFLFDGERPADMCAALRRALQVFAQPALWQTLQLNGMQMECSWAASAKEYLSMYARLCTGPLQQAFFEAMTCDHKTITPIRPELEVARPSLPRRVPARKPARSEHTSFGGITVA